MGFPKELAKIICEYAATWQILPWIEKLVIENPKLIRHHILQLWENPNGIDLALRMNLPMSWANLSANPNPWAVERLMKNPSKICYKKAFTNPKISSINNKHISEWLKEDLTSDTEHIAQNSHSIVVDALLSMHSHRFIYLCTNPNSDIVDSAIRNQNVNNMAWSNPNPRMFNHIMYRTDFMIDWQFLSMNSYSEAMRLLRDNINKINWPNFLTNPGIFTLRVDAGVFEFLCDSDIKYSNASELRDECAPVLGNHNEGMV